MRCDVCGSPDFVGVAAVPAFPVSLAWCKWCLSIGAMPLFTAEATMCDDDLSLEETIQKHGVDQVKGVAAEWFLDMPFWIPAEGEGPGHYMSLRSYLSKLAQRV
jgi:hypothetical protein